jgi:stress-induced morphogen
MAEVLSVTEADLKRKLFDLLQATHVEIEDMSGTAPLPLYESSCSQIVRMLNNLLLGGCGQAFSAIIVSPQFEKKTTLARHRLVNNTLKAEVAAIHAWTPKCYTPEQWEKQRQDGNRAVAPGKDTTGEVVTGTAA